MEKVLNGMWVGGDTDYNKLKNRPEFSFLRCCKDGPGGHKETVGYNTRSAPKGPEYLAAVRGHRMALNYIDNDDPNYIPEEMIKKGLRFIDAQLASGRKILVACNAGHSRGPTMAMLYMRSIGELPYNFVQAQRIFHGLYSHYDPDIGVHTFARQHWGMFENWIRGING
jgi:protein-tyrosine phosphatase